MRLESVHRVGVFLRIGRVLIVVSAALAAQPVQSWAAGGLVEYIEAREVNNPPPSAALDSFDRFELSPIQMAAPDAGQAANESAKTRLQTNLDERVPQKDQGSGDQEPAQ